jgi:hypothetical protein
MAATYLDARRNLAAAYHRAYFDREAGLYAVDGVGYRQTMNAMPLALGAVPESETPRVLDSLDPRYRATYERPPRLRRHRSEASATGAQRARTSRSGPDHRHSAHRTFLGCMDVLREWHSLGGMERLPQPQPLLPWFGRGMATRERRWTRADSSRMATIRGPAARRRPCPAGVGKPLLAWPNGCGCLDQERPHLGCLGGRPPSVTSAPLAARSPRAGAPPRRTPLPPSGRANVAEPAMSKSHRPGQGCGSALAAKPRIQRGDAPPAIGASPRARPRSRRIHVLTPQKVDVGEVQLFEMDDSEQPRGALYIGAEDVDGLPPSSTLRRRNRGYLPDGG